MTEQTEKREYNQADQVEVEASRCRKCGSTERTGYENTRTTRLSSAAVDRDGNPYNLIKWKRTKCLGCGQSRDDVFREFAREPKPEPVVEPKREEQSAPTPTQTSKRKRKKQKRGVIPDRDPVRDPTPAIERMRFDSRIDDEPEIVGDAF